jgi:hypothetical protein
MTKPIETDRDVELVARRFEACETGKDDFRHQDHVAVAVWYLQTMGIAAATDRMRTSLFRFLDHYQIDRRKYHETLTVFWMEMVSKCLASFSDGTSLREKCSRVQEILSDKDLVLEFYSPEVLWSDAARNSFIAPDKKSWIQ